MYTSNEEKNHISKKLKLKLPNNSLPIPFSTSSLNNSLYTNKRTIKEQIWTINIIFYDCYNNIFSIPFGTIDYITDIFSRIEQYYYLYISNLYLHKQNIKEIKLTNMRTHQIFNSNNQNDTFIYTLYKKNQINNNDKYSIQFIFK